MSNDITPQQPPAPPQQSGQEHNNADAYAPGAVPKPAQNWGGDGVTRNALGAVLMAGFLVLILTLGLSFCSMSGPVAPEEGNSSTVDGGDILQQRVNEAFAVGDEQGTPERPAGITSGEAPPQQTEGTAEEDAQQAAPEQAAPAPAPAPEPAPAITPVPLGGY